MAQTANSGIKIPWLITTGNTLSVLHYLASWVWGNGGHFISVDGKRLRFDESAAKEGIYNYFNDQLPYLAAPARNLDDSETANLFVAGEAATIFSGYWLIDMIRNNPAIDPIVAQNLGIASFPMPSFVGGSHLVIWKDTNASDDALALVKHLTSHDVQMMLPRQIAQVPARKESLAESLSGTHSYYEAILNSLQSGRTFSAPYMWGLVESRLLPMIVGIWQELFEDPNIDLKARIDQRLDPLAERLSMSLST